MHYHTPKPFFRKSRKRWYVQIGGKQINLGPDKEEAFRRYYQLMADAASGIPAVPKTDDNHLVASLCEYFLEWVQRNRSPDTYEWYRYRLQRFVDHHPDLTAAKLRPFHVERWVDSYELSTTSRRNYYRSIKRCLKWAVRQGYIEKNPLELLEVPSGESREIYVPPDEFKRMLEFVTNDDFRDLLVATYTTGCRPQESLRVQTRHVQLEHRRWVFPTSESKGKREPRIVYMSDESQAIVERRIRNAAPNAHIFCNAKGKPWTTEAVNCAFDRLQERMGRAVLKELNLDVSDEEVRAFIPKLSPTKREKGKLREKRPAELRYEAVKKLRGRLRRTHATRYSLYAFRHSWATNSLKRGLDALTVAVLMGHRDPSQLARTYQHLGQNPEHMQEQARKAANNKKKKRK
ncbi:Tyrosine recombinase XerD [Crateriforma conspicua]|uniref:Tyrosine recombinase XerD n=1 Tax=Crateriforma conspicua TaxID=2527996 RepID=A0A5C6FTK4_9PLAN|nr:tyrosine-type recombinase/integrase [Crateriforma conspicua]TWU64513.1 Tyrosine recombinase XerD [Crateriforma conspicua]